MARRRRSKKAQREARAHYEPVLAALLTPPQAMIDQAAEFRAHEAELERRIERVNKQRKAIAIQDEMLNRGRLAWHLEGQKRSILRKPDQRYYRMQKIKKTALGKHVKFPVALAGVINQEKKKHMQQRLNWICMDRAQRRAVIIATGQQSNAGSKPKRVTWKTWVECKKR